MSKFKETEAVLSFIYDARDGNGIALKIEYLNFYTDLQSGKEYCKYSGPDGTKYGSVVGYHFDQELGDQKLGRMIPIVRFLKYPNNCLEFIRSFPE